jgi:hypothetical protein
MRIVKYLTMIALMLLLCSWGEKGHQKINSASARFLPARLKKYKGWSEKLSAHGSDADNRKRADPTEGIKHYIDIDDYKDFNENHKIVEGKQEAIDKYGIDYVKKNGTLPWVTDSTYHALVDQYRAKQWHKVLLTAAGLGHYVGDGHMPLHLTVNYDGKSTGQSGIHSRYESKMINRYVDSISVKRSRLHKVKDTNRFIFAYIYDNYQYKDSLLVADKFAFEAAGRAYNDLYYQILWNKTKGFTTKMIGNASKSLEELIRSAWIEAGKPKIPKVID